MLKEIIPGRVKSNRCPICNKEFTTEYLASNEVTTIFYTSFMQKMKVCKKHSFNIEK